MDLECSNTISVDASDTLEAKYDALTTFRTPYIQRAEDAAELTIPHLFPRRGNTSATEFYTPFQSVGSNGVNSLSAKLQLALLPPNNPFFRLTIDELEAAKEEIDDDMRQQLDKALAKVERAGMKEIEILGLRSSFHEGLRQLIIAGNALLNIHEDGCRVFRLSHYVVERDCRGNVLKIITCESVGIDTLPKEIKQFASDKKDDNGQVKIFTGIFLEGKKWKTYQEVAGVRVPDSEGSYKKDELPYIALRWNKVDGEHYGRGYIEEYIGDLNSAEGLSKAILDGSAAAARLVFLVNPSGMTQIRDIAQTVNGGFCAGMPDDVTPLQFGKQADMAIAAQTYDRLEARLNKVFLSGASGVRDAERVTAAEIRMISQELETTLGGLYSVLSQEFQIPLVGIIMARLKKKSKLELPKEVVKPAIVTGVDALGRGNEVQRLDELIGGTLQIFGEQAAAVLNMEEYIKRKCAALGVDPDGLVKTQEDLEAERQNAMGERAIEQVTPEIAKGLANQPQQ